MQHFQCWCQAFNAKEAERKEEFIQEKANLEAEVKELKEKQLGREELYAKLKEDSKIRWHRDEYKKLLKRFDEYYNKLEQKNRRQRTTNSRINKITRSFKLIRGGNMKSF